MAEKRKRRWTIPILLPQSRKGRSVSGRNCSLRSGLLALALLPVFDTTSPGKGGGWNRAGARHGSFTPPRFSRSCVQEYYYGHSGEQYAFFRIPKLLITDSRFDGVSSDAKLLYGLLLDRMELSYRNGWVDDQNRVFIIFTVEEVMETLRCRSEKAVRLFAELDSKKGIGLIERKRQGLGKPAIIYVKNFAGDIS